MKIHEALNAVMKDIGPVDKSDWNDFHKYRFRGIDRILDAVAPALRAHGVTIVPQLRKLKSRDVTTDKGKQSREVTLWVDYIVMGPEGDSITVTVPGESQDTGDKGVSKAMSVALRTALIQLFAIATGDADPDSESHSRGTRQLAEAVAQVQTLASAKGWSFDDLKHDFAASHDGADIQQADLKTLKAYIEQLDPQPATVRVSRRRGGAS